MCGIAGIVSSNGPVDDALLRAMGDALERRGPDSRGLWKSGGVGLSHRRLAVVDLSPAGHQPMVSSDGRWVLVFNGEIYNHQELRARLATRGTYFKGHSDTEVLIEAVAAWGVEDALRASDGMFALALWDRVDGRLVLARDRFGEKPLYAGWVGSDFLFASTLAAFRCHPEWRPNIEPRAARWMLSHGYVPAPWSIQRGVYKLAAGRLIELSTEEVATPWVIGAFEARQRSFYVLTDEITEAKGEPWRDGRDAAVTELGRLLDDAVGERLEADVQVGAFLSGGIDSSLVVESMARQRETPVDTFTIAFESRDHDESDRANATAQALGTRHRSFRMTAADVAGLASDLPNIYDEPFADAAQLPAILLSRMARMEVTVALTGDAGDEFFHGYQRYLDAEANWRLLRHLPAPWRRRVAGAGNRLSGVLPGGRTSRVLARQAGRIGVTDLDAYAAALLTFPGAIVASPASSADPAWPPANGFGLGVPERLRFIDQSLLLPEGIHAKLDRASMGSALELRVPLLDRSIVRFAWRLPDEWHASGGVGKKLLRELARRRLPAGLHDLPKRGFDVPLSAWLRGPLQGWADALLARDSCPGDVFEMNAARAMFQRHLSGEADNALALWAILVFLGWADRHG